MKKLVESCNKDEQSQKMLNSLLKSDLDLDKQLIEDVVSHLLAVYVQDSKEGKDSSQIIFQELLYTFQNRYSDILDKVLEKNLKVFFIYLLLLL